MLQRSIIYLVLSILAIVFVKYVQWLVVYVDYLVNLVDSKFSPLAANGGLGDFLTRLLLLMLLPVVIVGIPALIYRFFKKRSLPYFYEALWIVWLIIILSTLLVH